ncbi:MAG: bacteriohemerythrin, partial [Spirochaetaceae bacterium]|nr:bacteriohemerythrin [Spirochaetaceae bacterium]
MFIEWNNEKYNLGIELIDNQHKELVMITNQLHDILKNEEYQAEAIKILKRLYAYSNYHFSSEEGLFKEHHYPQAKEHINLHNTFANKIKEYLEEIRKKKNLPLDSLQDYLF